MPASQITHLNLTPRQYGEGRSDSANLRVPAHAFAVQSACTTFSPTRSAAPVALDAAGGYNAHAHGHTIISLDCRAEGALLLPGAERLERLEGEALEAAAERALARLLEVRPPDDRRTALVVSEAEAEATAVATWLRDNARCRKTFTLCGSELAALAAAHPFLCGAPQATLPTLPTQIRPLLFLGSLECAQDARALSALGVADVVSLLSRRPTLPAAVERLTYIELDDDDAQDLGEAFELGLEAIAAAHRGGRRVLVHCERGASRSVSLICAHLMGEERLELDAALGYVRRCRPEASPNPGFLMQLREREAALGIGVDLLADM